MEMILIRILREIIFWMAWIIIPLIMEIIPAMAGFIILLKKKFFSLLSEKPFRYPEITVIVPVYNSADTLWECLQSIFLSSYPNSLMEVLVVNNESKDNSIEVFKQCQSDFKELSMSWLNSKQGKSKALNLALFNSKGKYIIHIDSDGKLEEKAIENIVVRFEQHTNEHCYTGAVLTDIKKIEATDKFFMRLIRRCEFYEYCQAFLAGRNFESEINSIYTISGAFSAFRKSIILKTQLYNSETVSEDTHVTFQIRQNLKKRVYFCEDAFFFVDPIENLEKLYTQRQRWQRGELEVAYMFKHKKIKGGGFFSNYMTRLLMFDHTFAFPRMIWYFALFYLVFLNYPLDLIIGSIVLIYLLYTFSILLYYLNIKMYLSKAPEIKRYYVSRWYLIFILPLFNFALFWVRVAGIINSVTKETRWKSLSFSEELKSLSKVFESDFKAPKRFLKNLRKKVNNE